MMGLKLTIRGIVQKVGYRNAVYRAAKEMKIKGYVKNLDDPDESVEAVIQHPDSQVLETFIKKIKINDGFIEVHEILKEEIQEKECPKFEIIRGSSKDEEGERLDVAEMALKNLTKAVVSGNQKIIEKQDEMINVLSKKQDQTIKVLSQKHDETNAILTKFSEETHISFDVMEKKYGAISEKLGKLDKMADSFDELVEILRMFKPKE